MVIVRMIGLMMNFQKMPEAIPESICLYFFCEIKEAVLVNDCLQKKKHLHNLTNM